MNYHKLFHNKGLTLFLILFVFLCIFYPIYFMADDWEHIYHYLSNHHWQYIKHWVFRNPTSVFLIYTLFPLYIKNYFILMKFILWGSIIFSTLFMLKIFIPEFDTKFKNSYWWGPIPIILAFPPNNYEWNLWPIVSVLLIVFPFLTGIFYFQHKKNSVSLLIIKSIIYVIAFFAFESLLFFFFLIELAYILYIDKEYKDSTLLRQVIALSKRVVPAIIICIVLKYFMQKIYSYPYVSKLGFKPHLFFQYLNLSFNHDYYKTRWLTGIFQIFGIFYLLFVRIKTSTFKNLFKKDFVLLCCYILSAFYYFYIMDYSSRRAVGGQLYFMWGLIVIAAINLFLKTKKIIIPILIFVPYFVHQIYIATIKYNDLVNYKINAQILVERAKNVSSGQKIDVTQMDAIKNIKTGWNVVIPDHLRGYCLYFLPYELQKSVNISW